MKMKTYASFDDYLKDQAPGNQAIIRALRRLVKRVEPELQEKVRDAAGVDERAFAALLRQAAD